MDKTLVLFVVAVTAIAIICSLFFVCYIIRRRGRKQEIYKYTTQNHQKDTGLWGFLIIFGIIFCIVPVFGLIFQTLRTQGWVENPAVISKMQESNVTAERGEYIFVTYEFNGQLFENIDTNTSVSQHGVKNPTKAGQEIIILVNPDTPNQIMAFNSFYYGIQIVLILVGVFLCFVGIFNLKKTREGASKWRTADDPPVALTEEEEYKSRIAAKIFALAIIGIILIVTYWLLPFRVFLIFMAWMLFVVVYGTCITYKKRKRKKTANKLSNLSQRLNNMFLLHFILL